MRVPSTDTLGEASAAVAEPGNDVEYIYEIHVEAHTGLRRRWRGRLVTVDDAGMRRYGRWLSARTREQVVEALWNEAMFDIKYHVRHASAIVIGDPPL